MNSLRSEWHLIAATISDILRWSYGKVTTLEDLYDPRIFGPTTDLSCLCGSLRGEEAVGSVCDKCGVFVSGDSVSVRRLRVGHTELAVPIPSPFDDSVILDVFPVAPILYRRDDHGTVTPLGERYQTLVRVNRALLESMPEKWSAEYLVAARESGPGEVLEAINDIIGRATPGEPASHGDSLLALLARSLAVGDPDIAAITRSCGLAMKMRAIL